MTDWYDQQLIHAHAYDPPADDCGRICIEDLDITLRRCLEDREAARNTCFNEYFVCMLAVGPSCLLTGPGYPMCLTIGVSVCGGYLMYCTASAEDQSRTCRNRAWEDYETCMRRCGYILLEH